MKKITAALMLIVLATSAQAGSWEYVGPKPEAATEIAALTPPTAAPYFSITKEDVETIVAEQITAKGAEIKKVKATMDPLPNATLHAADHPLKVSLQALQIDKGAKRWQAQAFIVGNRSTETIRPVSGRYETMITVPVLKRQLSTTDVIESADLSSRDIPERQLRKDTVTSADMILGKSPIRMISADRPIRATEVAMPSLVKKGQMVEMTYTTNHMHIRDQGEALEDGARGSVIRVKNTKTGKAVTARVEGSGHVEVNTTQAL